MTKTVVGSFDGYETAHKAARELMDKGFRESEISVVASNVVGENRSSDEVQVSDGGTNTGTGALAGGLVGGAAGLAVSLMGLAIPGIGPIIAAGPLVAALAGAGAGAVAGGLIGALTEAGVPEEHAGYYAETVRRGGALVTVRTEEGAADRAAQILREHGAFDIEDRASRWRESGWTGWDASAQPYSVEEAERERRLYGTHADPLSGLPLTADPEGDNRRDSTIRR